MASRLAALERVADCAALGYSSGAQLSRALQWLKRPVRQYQAWAELAS
jgi:hypothetical protein